MRQTLGMVGAAGEALPAVTFANMWTLSFRSKPSALEVKEVKGLAFVPFSSPISCLSTKLLWQ